MKSKISRHDFLRILAIAGGTAFTQACKIASVATNFITATPVSNTLESAPTTASQPSKPPAFVGEIQQAEIAIIGAGIAGLTAGYLLRSRNIRVLEANPIPGGRVISGKRGNFHYAKGTEYLGEPEGVLKRITRELNLKPIEIPEPMDAFYRNGKIYTGWEQMTRATVAESGLSGYNKFMDKMLGAGSQYNEAPEYDPNSSIARLDDITADDWFDEINAADIFRERYNVAARGLFGANLDEVSALCVVPEFAYDYEDEEPLESMDDIGYDPGEEVRSDAYTFPGGITDVTDALAADLGSQLELNSPVQKISAREGGYLIEYANGKRLQVERVILAIPAPLALQIAPDVLSPRQRELMSKIEYAPYLTCALFSDTPIFDKAFDLALPDGRFLTDLYDSTWVQRANTPALKNEATYIACAYIAAQSYRDRSILDLSDEQILARLIADLQDVIPNIESKITGYGVQRFPHAYPVLTPGAYDRMFELHAENKRNGILLAGDFMMFPTFEAAAETGLLAAEQLM